MILTRLDSRERLSCSRVGTEVLVEEVIYNGFLSVYNRLDNRSNLFKLCDKDGATSVSCKDRRSSGNP